MGQPFDPYYKWLGIPSEEQPANHYRLLGLRNFESDPDVIQAAADQRMAHLRTYQTGRYGEWSQRLLNEVAAAKICLLAAAKKTAYDERLRETMPRVPAAEPEAATEPDPTLALLLDAPRPRPSAALRHKKRLSVGAMIGGATAISAIVIAGLAYWSMESPEAPTIAAKQNEPFADRNGKSTEKKSLDHEPVPANHDKDQPSRRVAPLLSKSTAASASSSEEPPGAMPLPGPDAESQPPAAAEAAEVVEPESQPPDRTSEPAAAAPDEAKQPARDRSKDESAKAKTAKQKPARPTPRVSIRLNKWYPLLTSPNGLAGWEVGGCRFSYIGGIIDLRGGEMYCPIVTRDVTIRAKVKRHSASCIRLFVRNSDQGCYIAQLTHGSWSIIKLTRRPPDANRGPLQLYQQGAIDTLSTVAVTRNYSDVPFEMGFAVAGNALTVYLNRQPLLLANDAALTEGAVGIGTDNSTGLTVTDVEIFIPKGSLIADHRGKMGSDRD